MRDPGRIDDMLELLRKIWQLEPDLRLGQLIFNAARIRESELRDVYSIEDGTLRKGLVGYLELIKSHSGGLKLYKAMVWASGPGTTGTRVTVEAENLVEAQQKLEAQYGEGNVYDLHNEQEASVPR